MEKDSIANNYGSVTGVLRKSTVYTTRAGQKMQRLDILVPSTSPLEHPKTVSVHTAKNYAGQLEQEVTVNYTASTFLKAGKGAGSDSIFDSTRLEEN